MRIAFMGTPDFAVPTLDALVAAGHDVVAAYSQPPRPAGRGKALTPSPVQARAEALGIAIRTPLTLRDIEAQAAFAALDLDVAVIAAYGLILPQPILDAPRHGCLNVHASLLPRWRGAAPLQRAILAGDTESGVSIMLMDTGLDTGPILLQSRVPIMADTTGGRLHDQLAELGAGALLEALGQLQAGVANPRPQPREGATHAPKIAKAEALIDWRLHAQQIERQVRAFNPFPVAETRLDGEQLRIFAARAEREPGAAAPGAVVALRPDALVVRCGEGSLAVTQMQRPGRRPVSARDFINAHRVHVGQRCG